MTITTVRCRRDQLHPTDYLQGPPCQLRRAFATGAQAAEHRAADEGTRNKILFDGKRATGIQYRRGKQSVEIRARREIVLSGGSVNSPQLLQLSGVGPTGLLKDIGVPVHHELAGVGENLRDHFVLRMVARIKTMKTINQRVKGLPLMSNPQILHGPTERSRPVANARLHFWKSDPALDNGDLQISFTPASYEGVSRNLTISPA